MKLTINKKYYTNSGSYQGLLIFILITKFMSIRWFTDCDEWFIYIEIWRYWCRFSGAGFMKGKRRK